MMDAAGEEEPTDEPTKQVMLASSFKQHSLHAKKSILIPVRVQGVNSTTLINCGATDKFVNLVFMRQPTPLPHARLYKLGEGTTEVTHGFKTSMETGNKKVPMEFFVMNGKSSQGLVLGYTFPIENNATINSKTRELRLGEMSVHCLSTHLEGVKEEGQEKPMGVRDFEDKW